MPTIWNHGAKYDWCHICGQRKDESANVWYAQNAEHAAAAPSADPESKYVRICADCADLIGDHARDKSKPRKETK